MIKKEKIIRQDEDLKLFSLQQAAFLKNREFDKLDIETLCQDLICQAETVEYDLKNYFTRLIELYIILKNSPELKTYKIFVEVGEIQNLIRTTIESSPSIEKDILNIIDSVSGHARDLAIYQLRFDENIPKNQTYILQDLMKSITWREKGWE